MKQDNELTDRDKVRHLFADFIAEGKAEGKAEALRDILFAAMANRDIQTTSVARKRIERCNDPAQLHQWVLNAMSAKTLRDVW